MNANTHHWPLNVESPRYLLRRFTEQQVDLDIDFDASRLDLITTLLTSCLLELDGCIVDEEQVWDLSVAERLQGLLAIAHASTGTSTTAMAICNKEECRGEVELELGLSSFASETPRRIDWLSPDSKNVSCRLPTGNDQRDWQKHTHTHGDFDETWLANHLVELVDNCPPSSLPESWLEPLGTALEAADPLTALTVDTLCPFCGKPLCVEIDLELILIEGLRSQQRQLLEHVHRLASSYHWTETDIIAMPLWRRQCYLSRIAVETE